MVVLPGAGGEMGILPHHAPVLTTLKFGVVKVRHTDKERYLQWPAAWQKSSRIL